MNETSDQKISRPGMDQGSDRPAGERTIQKTPSRVDRNQKSGGPIPTRSVTPEKKKVANPANKRSDTKVDDFTENRYWIRILKGSALPLLYTLVSFFMLRKYVMEYNGFYEYDTIMIIIGFGLGLATMSGLTIINLIRASKKKGGIDMKGPILLIMYIPLVMIMVTLAMVYGLSTMWQFSIGFFVTAIFPPLIVVTYEFVAKGRFLVREIESPKKELKLILIPTGME